MLCCSISDCDRESVNVFEGCFELFSVVRQVFRCPREFRVDSRHDGYHCWKTDAEGECLGRITIGGDGPENITQTFEESQKYHDP